MKFSVVQSVMLLHNEMQFSAVHIMRYKVQGVQCRGQCIKVHFCKVHFGELLGS